MLLEHRSKDHSFLEDSLDLSAIWQVLAQNIRQIMRITGCVALLALVFVFLSHPIFTSNGSLYTGGIRQSAAPEGNATAASPASYLDYLSPIASVSDLQTQINILNSPALVQEAVLASGLNVKITGPGISSPPRFLTWKLFEGGRISAFLPPRLNLTAAYGNLGDPSLKGGKFKLLFGQAGHYTVSQHGAVVLSGIVNQPASDAALSLVLKTSNPGMLPAAGTQYRLVVSSPAIIADKILAKGLTVETGGTLTLPSEIINIQFDAGNPYQAKAFVDQLMNAYINKTLSWNSSAASAMEVFISNQLDDVAAQLATANNNLAAYQQRTGVISPPDNATAAINQETQYETQRAQLQLQVTALHQLWSALRNPQPGINPYLVSQDSGTPLSILSEQLVVDTGTLRGMQRQFTPAMSQVQALSAQIADEKSSIRSMITNQLNQAETNLDAINAQIAKYQDELGSMPAESLQVINLTRSSKVLGDLYVLLKQKQQEAALSKAAAVSNSQILMPGQLPLKTSSPHAASTLAMAVVVGLFGSCAWVLTRQMLSGRPDTVNKIRQLVKSRVFGALPPRLVVNSESVFGSSSEEEFSESLRLLRWNIYREFTDNKTKVILLTSASSGEGKSMIALNLAKLFSLDGKRVALVNADLWTGEIDKSLSLDYVPGTDNWMTKDEPIKLHEIQGHTFSVLTTGLAVTDADKLFNSARIAKLFSDLSVGYDFIIVDGPTLPHIADLLVLASHTDLILSVVRLGVSTQKMLSAHQDALLSTNAHQGLVLNGVSA